ncbi:MAG: serine/threonine protein phosphatase [Rhodobacterales bacterium]|nr:serine/threonine protein phosphatase [Rhodobacterales bacterium]
MGWLNRLTGTRAPADWPRSTPEVPTVPPGTRVYAIGDIHGRVDLLDSLTDLIRDDAKMAGPEVTRRVIVYLGDYVDRGPDTRQLLDRLLEGPPPGFEAVYLKGNHEDFMLNYVQRGRGADVWFMNGGFETLESYGLPVLAVPYAPAEQALVHRDFMDALPESHRAFLEGLALYHIEGDYLFVHAGVRRGIPPHRQKEEDLLWIRRGFLDDDGDFGHRVVHGHTIRTRPDERPNRIGIDTGAWRTDRLTALVLQDTRHGYLQT